MKQYLFRLYMALFTLLVLSSCGRVNPDSQTGLDITDQESISEPADVETSTEDQTPTPSPTTMPVPTMDRSEVMLSLQLGYQTLAAYDTLTAVVDTNVPANNPFDPAEIDIRLQFTSPSGTEFQTGAFYYEDWSQRRPNPSSDPRGQWLARFTPAEEGEWSVVASFPAYDLVTGPQTFSVTSSDHPGFIRVNPHNPRYLIHDDGTPFFGIGTNIAWYRNRNRALRDYESWFDHLSANGGNLVRIWMAPWAFALEWDDTPLGDYDERMYEAWLLDQVLQMAAERDIHVILVLINYGQFALSVNPEWDRNPYNAANGGMLDRPEAFVTDPAAKALFQRRLRYIGNRYSHYPNLLAWEWWNEVNWTPITDEDLIPWIEEMSDVLATHDPYNHLTTTSGHGPQSAVWATVDIVQKHEYNTRDVLSIAPFSMRDFNRSVPDQPISYTEFGYSPANGGINFEETGIHLHNGLWAPALSGYSGTGMYWWWDTYIDPLDLWYHFNGIATFLDGEDMSTYTDFQAAVVQPTDNSEGIAIGLRASSEATTLVWVRNRLYTTSAAKQAYEDAIIAKAASDFIYHPDTVMGQSVVVDGLDSGSYLVRLFDPQSSHWLTEYETTAADGVIEIELPPFTHDLAVKVTRR